MIPDDARVEMEAKIAAGYFAGADRVPLAPIALGRSLDD
jgi:hypothetical protein